MTPRIIVDLEPGVALGKILPGLDLLDAAYGATRGGARGMLLPISATGRAPLYTADLFDRPGLPALIVKCADSELERAAGLGSSPERILVTGERGVPLTDFAALSDHVERSAGSTQEIAALIDAETAHLKQTIRAGVHWVYLPTKPLYECKSLDEAEAERARLASASLAATRLNLRVGLYGPTGRHLPASLAAIEGVEEIVPTPDLWTMALRAGWEIAVSEFIQLSR